MSDSLILYIAIFVFLMMLAGLALTIWEFTTGQPKRENKDDVPIPNGPASLQSANGKPVGPKGAPSKPLSA